MGGIALSASPISFSQCFRPPYHNRLSVRIIIHSSILSEREDSVGLNRMDVLPILSRNEGWFHASKTPAQILWFANPPLFLISKQFRATDPTTSTTDPAIHPISNSKYATLSSRPKHSIDTHTSPIQSRGNFIEKRILLLQPLYTLKHLLLFPSKSIYYHSPIPIKRER